MAGALPTPAPVRDYYVSGAFPNPDNDSVSAPDYHIPGELPAAIQEPELVHTEHGPTLLEQVHMFEVPAQPSVVNRVAGIIYNVTLWTGICLVQGLLYPPRLVYSNRGRVRQAASDTYRVAMQAVGGIKRRAVELHRPRRAPTPHEELREIVRASHRPLRSSTLRPSRISPPKMTTLANEQLRLETLRHVQINELMRYNEEDLEYIPLPSTSTKSVKFVESPRTGRPVTRVKKFVVGEAMDFYMSSSPCVSSTYPEGSVERMEAEASESPLEYHLAKMEGCSHEDALKQIPNGAIPDRRTKYIISASGSPAERKAWNNKDKENTASPSNETFEAFATLTDAKTQNGKSEETIPSPMALPSGVSRTPDSAAAIDGKTQKEPKATSPTAEANMVTTTIATPTIPTTPMARSLSAKAAMDSMEQDMGVFSISSRTYKVRDTVRKQKAEEARLAKARRKAEERAKKEAEAEEERKKKSERRMPTEKVIKPLSAEWEKKVDAALAAGDGAQLATTSTGNTLKRKDFGTVLPVAGRDRAGGWLNDEIITGYLQAVVDHGQAMTNSTGRGKTPKYYAFNTFFYSNIRDKGVESVKRWATKGRIGGKALLDVERVFIPVHEHSHWTNIVVGPMARTIEYFDSMGGSPRRYIANVKAWLEQELGPAYVEEEWAVVNSSSPQQQNGLDCGVFAATTAKMIMLGINPMAYGHEDIPTQRRRMVAELLNGGFHGVFEP
ncbi:MAG: Smt3-specific protease [Pleopsidium flavum]|nr:MAG: Smt3-specific protease [Pleopsidium flavum]